MPAPSFVQANSIVDGFAPVSISVSLADTTVGNYLLVFAYGFGIGGTISDNQGNTYSYNVIGNGGVTEYRVNGCAGGPLTVTLTFGGSPTWAGLAVAEYANAAVCIGDQLENVSPGGNGTGDFSQCPAIGVDNHYIAISGAGADLTATYDWPPAWLPLTAYGGSAGTGGETLYVPNSLSPVTLEGATGDGVSGATEPAWVSGGVTVDGTVNWQDSGVEIPGDSLVALGVMGDKNDSGGTPGWTVNGPGWTLRTTATDDHNVIAVYDRAPAAFFSTYNISVSKDVDNFNLCAQLAHVTGNAEAPPATGCMVAWLAINEPTTESVLLVSTVGEGKVLTLHGGGSAPAGWYDPAFNDSTWTAPVQQTHYGVPIAGTQLITDSDTSRFGQPFNDLYRFHFTISVTDIIGGSLTLQGYADDVVSGVWINGTAVTFSHSGTVTISIPVADIVAGDNVLAIQTTDTIAGYTSLSFKLSGSITGPVWTDQSRRLHVSESITFSWLVRQRGTAQVPLIISAGDDYMPTIGSQVCLWDITEDADYEVFSGTIDDFEVKWLGQNGDRIVTLTCVSLEQVFDTIRLPNLLFTDKTAGFIFAAVYAYATGCPVALGTVNAGATIASFNTPDFPSISDVFTRLATESQYVWGVDPGTGTVYFTPPNVTPSPFTVDSEDVLWEQFTLKEERHDYRNNQKLKVNSNAAILSKELFAGTAQSSFTMLRPVSQITNAWLTQNVQNFATGTFTGQPAVGDTISFQTPQSGSTYNWSAASPRPVGSIIIDSNGFIQKVVTSVGVTGATEPSWIEIYGQITQDNLVQWQNQGPSGFSNGDLADYTFVDSLDGYYGAAGVWPITADNPTGQMPANAQFGLVLIGATLAETIQNLADAINAIQDLAGITFSLPTWENPVVNADTPAGATTIIVRNKAAEASYITALSESCARFSWSSALTTGGLTTFGTVVITFGVAGQTTGGSVFTIVYTPGSDVITSATPLQPGNWLQIEYAAVNSGYIQVENTADVIARAVIEGGTGKYQQTSSDDSALSMPVGLQLVQQQLAAFGIIPQTFEFTTMRAGLYVGQEVPLAMISPDNAPLLINGEWFIQEIKAEVVPVYGPNGESNRWLPGGGHFRYTVTCIDVAQIGSWLDFWLGLSTGGGGTGGGSAVFPGGGALGPASTGNAFGGVNEQTADYTALSTDNGRIISMHHATLARTLTLPATPPSTTWCILTQNTGAATVTVHPNGLQLDGVIADVTLKPGTGLYISTDGINYFTERGLQPGVPATVYTVPFSAVSSVVVTHNLGTTAVIVAVYDSTAGVHPLQVIPSTLEITSANVVTVTFGVATSGYVVVIGG